MPMEKPLPKKQFNRKVRQAIIFGTLTIILGTIGAYLKGCFDKSKPQTIQEITNNNSDSGSSSTVLNKDVTVKGDQISAGKDANIDKRKIEVKGDAFFDKSKQENHYEGIKQRHIDFSLMENILDSIPNKNVNIEIEAGGQKEGNVLANEIADFLVKKGYKKATIIAWDLTGDWDKIQYRFDVADSTFRIEIHPQGNVKELP